MLKHCLQVALHLPLLLCFTTASAQSNTDSTAWILGKEYLYQDIIDLTTVRQADSALFLSAELIKASKDASKEDQVNAQSTRASVLFHTRDFIGSVSHNRKALELKGDVVDEQTLSIKNQIAVGYRYEGKLDSAAMALEFVLDNQSLLKDSFELGRTYYTLNSVYTMQARFDEALKCLYKALDINNALGEYSTASIIKVYLGSLLHDSDEHELAFSYQQEAEDYFKENGEDDKLLFVFMERSVIYERLGHYEKAISDLTRGIALAEKFNHTSALANMYELLGDVYFAQERYDEAEANFLKSLESCEKMAIPYGIASAHSHLSELYLKTNRLNEALESALIIERISTEHEFPRLLLISKERLSEIYSRQGEFESAFEAKLAEHALSDSLDTKERAEALDEIREKYESEKNQREVERLRNEAELDRVKRNSLIAGLSLLLLLSLIIINREVQRRKKARALHESEIEVQRLERLNLEETVRFKNRELNSMALNIAQKNDLLENLKKDLKDLQRSGQGNGEVLDMVNKLRISEQIEGNWEEFTRQFTETNPSFYKRLTESHTDLTKSDLRLAALLRMNLNSKDISRMLSISDEGVKKARYRLRKKLDLQTDDSLEGFILSL